MEKKYLGFDDSFNASEIFSMAVKGKKLDANTCQKKLVFLGSDVSIEGYHKKEDGSNGILYKHVLTEKEGNGIVLNHFFKEDDSEEISGSWSYFFVGNIVN